MRKKLFFMTAVVIFFGIAVVASASHAPTNLTIVRHSAKTVTVGWSAVPGVTGYGLYRDGTRIATAGASATQAKFGTPEYRQYVLGVEALKTGGAMSTITVEPRWVATSVNIPPEPPPAAQCSDGLDNDGDAKIDFPADPGCTSATDNDEFNAPPPPPAQCADGLDNDGDAKIDYPADPGCTSVADNDEFNAPPPPPAQCADGLDNDGDSKIDLADPGCTSATDNDETDVAPPPSGLENVWVDANGGTCVRSLTAGAYVDAQSCGSFLAAYSAAVSGDTVGVTGSLGTQKFAGGWQSTQGSGTKVLLFRGVTGNKVRQIHMGSPNLTFDGVNVDGGMVAQTGAGFENGGRPFVFKNGTIGNVKDEKGALVTCENCSASSSIVFDNVLFHDVELRTSGVHLECIMALSSEGMTIRNSTFRNCGIMDISVGIAEWWSPQPGPYGNVKLEGNWFGNARFDNGGCCATYSVALWATKIPVGSDFGQLNGWTIRNNYVEPGSSVIVRPTMGTGTVICGNTGNVPGSWAVSC